MRRLFSDKQAEEICEKYSNGRTYRELAKEYFCSTGAIQNVVHGVHGYAKTISEELAYYKSRVKDLENLPVIVERQAAVLKQCRELLVQIRDSKIDVSKELGVLTVSVMYKTIAAINGLEGEK